MNDYFNQNGATIYISIPRNTKEEEIFSLKFHLNFWYYVCFHSKNCDSSKDTERFKTDL